MSLKQILQGNIKIDAPLGENGVSESYFSYFF